MNKNLQEIGTNIRPATDNLDAYIKEETEMTRTIITAQEGFLEESLDFVEKVFTESEGTESGEKNYKRQLWSEKLTKMNYHNF